LFSSKAIEGLQTGVRWARVGVHAATAKQGTTTLPRVGHRSKRVGHYP